MRNTYYTKAMKDNEMLKTLTKVHDQEDQFILVNDSQSDTEYNAFERDIAIINIFFGKTTAIGKTLFHEI